MMSSKRRHHASNLHPVGRCILWDNRHERFFRRYSMAMLGSQSVIRGIADQSEEY
jgi:hypothetical protein